VKFVLSEPPSATQGRSVPLVNVHCGAVSDCKLVGGILTVSESFKIHSAQSSLTMYPLTKAMHNVAAVSAIASHM
jgi:hypothetical protein